MNKLKVLMMGGRRCGKTSALASLFDQMVHGPSNTIFTVSDVTDGRQKFTDQSGREEKIEKLSTKKGELEDFISDGGNSIFLADKGPTRYFWLYTLQVKIPGSNRKMCIEFRDSAGEFFDSGSAHGEETRAYLEDCDVFVVVIDTPYLMAEKNSVCNAANVTDSIHTFLTQIKNRRGADAKQQVIFLPIKCEKWIKDGKIDQVVQKVKTVYDATLKDLLSGNNEVTIMPIETAGDILFESLRESSILYNRETKERTRCAKDDEETVILPDGRFHELEENEEVKRDPEAVFADTDIRRPSAWYRLRQPGPEYTPHNCEQLPLHIIRFMFDKAKAQATPLAKLQKVPLLGPVLAGLLEAMGFGTIRPTDLDEALNKLEKTGLLKEHGDGIEILKRI